MCGRTFYGWKPVRRKRRVNNDESQFKEIIRGIEWTEVSRRKVWRQVSCFRRQHSLAFRKAIGNIRKI